MFETCRSASLYLGTALLASLAAAPTASSVETPERAILVLDASGSMWGQVEGTPKIKIARDVIKDLLGEWNPNVELGVTAYGHRQKGDCTDIETLVPVGPVDDQVVLAAIEPLNPRGKTPLTDAVRQAADTLQYTEERATVLLVSDGKETCDADPCAAAAELDAKGVDFKVHVVGFDLTGEEKAQLECIADNTGGQFLSADNAPELHQAMATTVQLVAEAEPEAKVQPIAAGPTGVELMAALTEGGESVKALFTIFKLVNGEQDRVTTATSKSGEPAVVELAPGRYVVEVRYGDSSSGVKHSAEIGVEAYELVKRTIVVPAGRLQLTASLSEDGEPVEGLYNIYDLSREVKGKRDRVENSMSTPEKPALIYLPEGNYLVAGRFGGMERFIEVDIAAGDLIEETVILGTGRLRLSALLSEGGKAVPANFHIVGEERDYAGIPTVKTNLDSGDDPAVTTELPIGRYQISARYGEAEVSGEVEVWPGEEIETSLILDIGHLSLASVMAEGGEPVEAVMSVWTESDQNAGLRKIIDMKGEPGQPLRIELPADDYVVKANYGEAEMSSEVEVGSGLLTEEIVVLNAGYLDVSGARSEEGPAIDVAITIYGAATDGKRAVVAEADGGADETAEFVLTAGRYLVVASDGEKEMSIEVEVEAGEHTETNLIIPDEVESDQDGQPKTDG